MAWTLAVIAAMLVSSATAVLTPPYFNLAEGRKISATATCGVGFEEPELYCKLVGANMENYNHSRTLIQGQVCDYCDPTVPDRSHPPEYAIDGTSNWWQSPPLSRGMKYNEVNLTIDFGQEFHVAYLFIRMGNSPRPGLWTLEKSKDYGQTWSSWQHFSDSPSDCDTYFGKDSLKPITRDDDVICTTEYSKIVPLEDGEIPVMLLNNRPSANNYFNSTVLQEWTRATNVRFRFLRTKNLLGHLMSVARQDPSVTRRYFYSIRDISIGGRCMCNGHADTCDVLDSLPNRVLACQCQHHTCGIQCAECCPGFVQKKWRQNTNALPFQCEPCNCFDHSSTCVYDAEVDAKHLSLDINGRYEGGGVCQDCRHNTKGINCNQCEDRFYRPYGRHWNESTVCQACDCDKDYSTGNCEEETGRCECAPAFAEPDCQSCSYGHFGFPKCRPCVCNLNGTEGYHCEPTDGRCPCRHNFGGEFCKECAAGYYGLPECLECNCNTIGAVSDTCQSESGQCECRGNFDGRTCDRCKDGYYNYPQCLYCDCDLQGTVGEVCSKESGQCICKEGFGGPRCDQCLPGYFNYPNCEPCNCSTMGSSSTTCDATGRCLCLPSFAGKQCTQCSTGHYAYPDCLACNCESHGRVGISCNNDGQCSCSPNFDGKTCNQCKEGFYNFPACEDCNCDPAGVIAKFAGCGSVPAGELCQCKSRVAGRICNECKPLYWNLNVTNPDGCEECNCFLDGTIGNLDTCSSKSGQCPCKPNVDGRSCDQCRDGSFDLYGSRLFGCDDCGCDIGGSISTVCNKFTGQCNCHPRVAGRTCSSPLTMHYFPTLYQNQFEYEDGKTPSDADVRYLYDEEQFPGFSKRGYAKFSDLQSVVRNNVTISKSSVYRMVIRYVNPTASNVVATISITTENPTEVDQTAKVLFKPTTEPQFVTVSGAKEDFIAPIVLDGGRYEFTIKTDKFLFLDYFVLLPQAYYEGTRLTKKIVNPCEVGDYGLCRHYTYPTITEYIPSQTPFVRIGDSSASPPTIYYEDEQHLALIGESRLPSLIADQPQLTYIVNVEVPGPYIVVVDYVTYRSAREPSLVHVNIVGPHDDPKDGVATLYTCTFTTVCRQPVIDQDSREKVFWLDPKTTNQLEIIGDQATAAAIKSISIVPLREWSVDLITPSPVCVMQDGRCVQTNFLPAPNARKVEFEAEHEDRVTGTNPPALYDNSTRLIYLDVDSPTVDITSKVPAAGRYHILVQYFQPNHHQFNIDYHINNGDPTASGKLPLKNCPSNSGCRVLIRPTDNGMWFELNDNVTITFTNHLQKGVWLDYALLVPVSELEPAYAVVEKLLQEEPFDQTKEFIQQCGHNHFHIQLNASEFCKQAVFSLTSDYNHGALPCGCHVDGSNSFECDPFGGQCQCRENVIGRQCDACRTGFFGFPDCKPCNCPSTALCQKETGNCICPPRVTGEKCDKCEHYTFGFDQIIGCELCNCHVEGVRNNDLQCDLNNGTCACRPNIEGRTCDHCITGHYDFPNCRACRCNHDGTTFDICNPQDETCYCKKNVEGVECNQCAYGTYNLQASNPDGCSKCYCSGKTQSCERARLRQYSLSLTDNLSVNTFNATTIAMDRWPMSPQEIALNETQLQLLFGQHEDVNDNLVYFGMIAHLPQQHHHLMAYGGELSYKVQYTTGQFGQALSGPDVILESNCKFLVHSSYEQPAQEIPFDGRVQMLESEFRTTSDAPVTRDQFMEFLRNLDAIYVRATYWQQTVVIRVSDVYLTIGGEDPDNEHLYEELSVEQCACPAGYEGYSCEECAPGYYRDASSGSHGGTCRRCECNGHADTCDVKTGVCNECQHSTTGDHCEQCIVGYYGDATYGSPMDCMICACPLPEMSNNFATSCNVSRDGSQISCQCRPGYTGLRCQSCAAGFYGQPSELGDFCRPCNCSGNIDSNDANACDTVTGDCLQCLHNTAGTACNLCAPGFYGDAIESKNCQNCICDKDGTADCDSYVGHCHCHPNVIGEKCDRCEDDHYGFHSGSGCTACDCHEASDSTQCDDHSGECRCKPGVAGRQCDRCARGFWNYTAEGCSPCACNTDYSRGSSCNVQTGQCECLPGVVGEKCDKCPYRWVLLPDTGCQECGVCHHALLDVTDALRDEIDPVIGEFGTTARGYYTAQKLVYLNESVDAIEPEVKALNPHLVNLSPLREGIDSLEGDLKTVKRRIQYTDQRAHDLGVSMNRVLNESLAIAGATGEVGDNAARTVRDVEALVHSFDTDGVLNHDASVEEAETIYNALKNLHVAKPIDSRLDEVKLHLSNVANEAEPVNLQSKRLNQLSQDIGAFSDKLENLLEWSVDANRKSLETRALLDKYANATANSKFETVKNQSAETVANIEKTIVNSLRGNITLDEIDRYVAKLKALQKNLTDTNNQLDIILPQKDQAHADLEQIIHDAREHGITLQQAADDLKTELSNITSHSETALKAATSYTNIVDAVNNANNAIKEAKYASNNATALCDGIDERARKSDYTARELLKNATTALHRVQAELEPHLITSKSAVQQIVDQNADSNTQLNAIDAALDSFSPSTPTIVWQEAHDQAIEAQTNAEQAATILRPIAKSLPQELSSAKELPKQVEDTNHDINQTKTQVERVLTVIPELRTMINEMERRQDETNVRLSQLGEEEDRLREQIAQARELANSIKVGVDFQSSTTLDLKLPSNIGQQAAKSNVFFYVNTTNPDGFVMYLGNENVTSGRNKRNDFMALELQNGYPILTIDIGDGSPQRIVGKKPINDGQWHHVQVSHDGPDVTLTVGDEIDGVEELHESTGVLNGITNLFNFDPEKTKLFVGGYPQEFHIQDGLRESSFEGQIEGLRIGDQDVGLWNFVDAQDNTVGAHARDRFVKTEEPTNGYRFTGHGYVIIDSKPYQLKRKSSINFLFKVSRDVTDGLIFYGGTKDSYIALELKQGGISFKYKLGENQKTIDLEMKGNFNDNEWHKVEAERDGRLGVLKIDSRQFYQEETTATEGGAHKDDDLLYVSDSLYFGGYPGKLNHTELTDKQFEGCIKDVHIVNTMVDLSKNLKAFGVRPGCPDKVSNALSFKPNAGGYLMRPELEVNNHLQVNLKFRTKRPEGLIFFGTDHSQDATIGLSVHEGELVFSSLTQQLSTEGDRFDDGEWHSVTATHDAKKLRIVVDDQYDSSYESQFNTEPLHIAVGEIYFGGLPKGYQARKNVVASQENFAGCISDVTIGRSLINFANYTDLKNAHLDNCGADIFDETPVVPLHVNEIDNENDEDDALRAYEQEQARAAAEAARLANEQRIAEERRWQAEAEDAEAAAAAAAAAEEEELRKERRRQQKEEKRLREEAAAAAAAAAEQDRLNELAGNADAITEKPPPATLRPNYTQIPYQGPVEPECALPATPDLGKDFSPGYRFGSTANSRVEFMQIAGKIKKNYDISLKFRTAETAGLVFYAADSRHTDFIALYLQGGQLHYVFNVQASKLELVSQFAYDNNQWHTVIISRQQAAGRMIINGEDDKQGDAPPLVRPMAVQAPFWFGGIHPEQRENMLANVPALSSDDFQFRGCITDMQINGKDLGIPADLPGTVPCSPQVEAGVFFGPSDGHVKLRDRFKVGNDTNIELEIRPRTNNALLMSVHGKKALLILELIDGSVMLTVNDGDRPYTTTWRPNDKENLCDGQWHSIKAIKSKYVITLQVDSVSSNPGLGLPNRFETNTSRALFLGGHQHLQKARSLNVRKSYVGCMRNVRINGGEVEVITNDMTVGDVQTGVCPTV